MQNMSGKRVYLFCFTWSYHEYFDDLIESQKKNVDTLCKQNEQI